MGYVNGDFVKIVISPRRNTIFSGLGVQQITEIFNEKPGEYFLANRMNFYGLGTRFWSDFGGLGDGLEGTKNKTKKSENLASGANSLKNHFCAVLNRGGLALDVPPLYARTGMTR